MKAHADFADFSDLTLSNSERGTVRRAITSHPGWQDYRTGTGYTAADMTSTRCLEACAALGIDPRAVLAQAEIDDAAPTAAPTAVDVDLFNEPAKPAAPTPRRPASTAADPLAALEALRGLLGGAVDADAVREIVDDALAPHLAAMGKPTLRVIDKDGRAFGADLPPTRHPMLDTLLTVVTARNVHGHRLNAWIAGPAGSGKTHAAKQIAEALGLTYGFHGAMTMEHQLTGFVDAGGRYHATQFVTIYEHGGVCLLDEVDAGSSEALLALNAALANGHMSLPDGRTIQRHTDFICIAAGNTNGSGATAEYVGRARIDASFLDRYVSMTWTYDEALERDICGNPEWARRVQKARRKAQDAGLKVLITPRQSIDGAALIANGMNPEQAANLTYLKGLTAEQVKMIEN